MKKLLFLFAFVFYCSNVCFADYQEADGVLSNKIPWSAWWWPMQDTNGPNLYDGIVEGHNGPLKNYDLFAVPYSNAQSWEQNNCSPVPPGEPTCTDGHEKDTFGVGHCDAWAATSIMEAEPKYGTSVGVVPSTGKFLNFTVGDLKGLLVETYMGADFRGYPPSFIYHDSLAITPADFLKALRENIRDKNDENETPVVIDLPFSRTDVFNYPVYEYSLDCKSKNDGNNGHSCTAKILHPSNELGDFPYDYVGHYDIPAVMYTFDIQLINGEPQDNGLWTLDENKFAPRNAWIPTARVSAARASRVNPYLREDAEYKKVLQLINAAPFVMQVQISQAGIKYDAHWEWHAAPVEGKNRLLTVVKNDPVVPAAGDVDIKLVFSRTMNPQNLPDVSYQTPGGSNVNTRNPAWSKTNFDNDTLTVTASVPCVSGKATLYVNGYDIQERRLDGNPGTFADKWQNEESPPDTHHHFKINQPATPQVIATVPEAEPVQPNHWKAKDVEVTSPVKIIFSEKMFEQVGDAKYNALLADYPPLVIWS